MPMTREQFEAVVVRLEEYARRSPGGYRLRVGLLAALGYAYLLLVLGAVFLLLYALFVFGRVNFVVVKVGWLLATFAALVVRAMWVRMPKPEGLEVVRADAPRLFALADETTSALDAPRVHQLVVTDELNASVWQVPRLGPLGWHRNYLALGLPLMQALPPEQFRAVLAHELGHLSGRHGRFGGWIYRVRQTWFQLLARLEHDQRWGSGVFIKFFNWYAPYFHAYSFVLARTHEYEADSAAARIAGPRAAAETLIDLAVKESHLSESFWPEVTKLADRDERPAEHVFAGLPSALRAQIPRATVSATLSRALAEKTGHDDTHPSLSDRLAALGYAPAGDGQEWAKTYEPAPLEESAAEFYFGDALPRIVEGVGRRWAEGVAANWRQRHEYARGARQRLAELDEKSARGPLAIEETWERACLAAEFREREEGLALAREVLAAQPDHAAANFSVGRKMIEDGDEGGIALVERAMADPELVLPGCEVLSDHFARTGRAEKAEEYQRRARAFYESVEEARQERAGLEPNAEFEPHALPPEAVEELRERLALYPSVREAYLARKRLRQFTDSPLYVLGLVTKHPLLTRDRAAADRELLQQLSTMPLPGEAFFVLLDGSREVMKRNLAATPDSLIYRR